MFKEIEDCYLNSAGVFVRVIVDTETNVMYLANKKNMIPMLSKDGKPSCYNENVKIINYTKKVGKLHKYVGWQNLFVNQLDGTMYVGGSEILCQLIDENGMPKIYSNR